MKQGTVRVPCTCTHEFQDKAYGHGVRVANTTQKGDDKTTEVRCTVCKSTQRIADSKVK